ncbi:MAG: FliM/FliN family flagellar motor switch protein [Rickettsiaceae bacterium H1]|nr:FliM/FliN family flagellar motor switch protein [Rickettsiaceae bacterium H1]
MTDSKIIDQIKVELCAVLGKSLMTVNEIKSIKTDSVIPLDKSVTDLIDIYANNQLIAKGELVSNENGLGVKITQLF